MTPIQTIEQAIEFLENGNFVYPTELRTNLRALLEQMKKQEPVEVGVVAEIDLPHDLHQETKWLVIRFAEAMASKLAHAQRKYGYSDGWRSSDWMDECRAKLLEHLAKGDPRDVANYCAFLWHHHEHTTPPLPQREGWQWVPDGWKIERVDKPPFKRILVKAPNGYSTIADSIATNPENILYMLADAMLAVAPKLTEGK